MTLPELRNSFSRAFPDSGEPRFFYAPGRVNLIGEHIDYNGGYVFPCALTLGTYAAICKRDDNTMRLVSANVQPPITVSTCNLQYDKAHGWANNPKSVTKLLIDAGHKLTGYDIFIWGNLPNSAGLSSSASINVLVATALNAVFDLGLTPVEIALLCQRAENEYLGVNCGIMDQFASAMGKKDHAILLDCSTLEYKYVPLELGDFRLVLANTNKPRALADSKYNERRAECDYALSLMQKVCDAKNLCEITNQDFTELSLKAFGIETVKQGESVITPELRESTPLSPEAVAFQRAYHAVHENHRVKIATDALAGGNLATFGMLVSASHTSLRDFYEVTGDELDALVNAAQDYLLGVLTALMPVSDDGTTCDPDSMIKAHLEWEDTFINDMPNSLPMLGSRMTGAGFGGCTVSIVHKDHVDNFIKHVGADYTTATGLVADFYVAEVDDGAREVFICQQP